MSIFSSIWNKITGHSQATADAGAAATGTVAPPNTDSFATFAGSTAPAAGVSAPQSGAPVDVEAVLTSMAAGKPGGGGNWRTSIVDLLKLLDLDSSLSARSELGKELGVQVGADGSAEQNIALHKAVMQKMAENGGKVPDSMRH